MAGDVAQLVCVKLGVVDYTCDPSAWEVKEGGTGQDHPWLGSEFKASLANRRLSLKRKNYVAPS